MEPVSRLSHDPLPKVITTNTLPSGTLLSKHLHSTLLELARVSALLLVISIEVLSFLREWNPIFHLFSLSCFFLFFIVKPLLSKPHIYIVDFSCFKPPNFCRVPTSSFLEHSSMIEPFDRKSIDFMAKLLKSSGLGEQTHLSPALYYIPPIAHLQESIKEVHMVLFPVMEDLLSKTKLSPRDIDILIINCSSLCSSPSLSSIIINKYSMRDDIKSFNLSGMGCSAGILSTHLAQNLLKVHKNSYAIVLSTEITSAGWYAGNDRSKLLVNCIFRMGGAAILLTNKEEMRKTSKYRLLQTVRIQRAFDDRAYLATVREEDSNGALGVSVSHDLVQVVAETVRSNITILGSCILPFLEKFKCGVSMFRKRYISKSAKVYVPDFKKVIQHFVLPASGRSWIREIGKGLKLGKRDTEASLMTLRRFGNQSSSSSWYVLAYLEAKERMKKGDKVWQLGIGSGPKCISFVWECNRPIVGESMKGPWADCIDEYPVLFVDEDK
ncbi:3-ketoacyl-CoA synthase 5 [Vitis vinifera]|uniref:3-ketoacyl-CoA synthase n=1 Tax=Vitis vinifera TaxID=29760 RepID=A0A438I1S7_VITVI|nr:3-ketoacyl-CoA synthase 5 [Vitis vinifera]